MKAVILSDTLGAGAGAFKDGFRSIIGEGKVLKKFSPTEKNELGKDIVGFIKSLQKGNVHKPLEKDTFYFSTHSRPAVKSAKGEVLIPEERVLHIDKPANKWGGYRVTLSTEPLILNDGTICSYPMTMDGLKAAIKELKQSAKRDIP